MSVVRKSVLSVAVLGAALVSTAGVASATTSHHAAGGCSNAAAAESSNSSGRSLGDTTGGSQDLSASNLCNVLNRNEVASSNNAAGGDVVNGDTTTVNRSRTSTDTVTSTLG